MLHTVVYTAALVLHSMVGVYREEVLGSRGKNPLGESLL